jgi:SAM-dependent methyltransferase
MEKNDPIGAAIEDYLAENKNAEIVVESDLSEDDTIPVSYLFRQPFEMPVLEQKALSLCNGEILDVGCGAGAHMKALKNKGFSVEGIDISPKAIDYLKELNFTVYLESFMDFKGKKYDTILLLMNGLGLAGNLHSLADFLKHAKSLLKDEGKILCDSTDVRYFYEDEEGSIWMDLNAAYYGDFKFKMNYKKHTSGWFNWLYVDFQTLLKIAEEVGLKCTLIESDDENSTYLAELKINHEK